MASNLSHNHQHGVNGIGTALTVLDICTGAGGEALGLEMAGFNNVAAIEIDARACQTLRLNRPAWNVIESDIRAINGNDYKGVDLLAGGVPCPPFTIAGKQLGSDDERDLFPEALHLIEQVQPKAVLLENVPGFASAKFASYRNDLLRKLYDLHYAVQWRVLNSSDYGAPQLRPRFVLVALREPYANAFRWPVPGKVISTVNLAIGDLMAARGWHGVTHWYRKANGIAPTLVGGSKKHGGPDLGPTRARKQWAALGIDGLGIANDAPDEAFPADGMPRLTLRMAARIQAFPDTWQFAGGKTAAYRQIGNAFPPLVAQAVGESIMVALTGQHIENHNPSWLFQPGLFYKDDLLQSIAE
ncbi:MAG TPA: DNA cytosine methyltransferase [Ktedonobacteraceae bacterium]|nr:DNA cytosine methyltransferase [Ktedonobacteraceae bacterium]